MNHRCIDVLSYHLWESLYLATWVTSVTGPTVFTVEDATGYASGNAITVDGTATVVQNVAGNVLTVAPAVAGVARRDVVKLAARYVPLDDFNFYKYKDIDGSKGSPPDMKRPFLAVYPGMQFGDRRPGKSNIYGWAYEDITRVSIYIEGRMVVKVVGGASPGQHAGFEIDMLPAIELVRRFVHMHRSLAVPASLVSDLFDGWVAMTHDGVEYPYRGQDFERHIIPVTLKYFDVTKEA